MWLRLLFLTVTVLLLSSSALGTAVLAQERPTPPSQVAPSVTQTTNLPVETLDPVDGASLRREAQARRESGPYRYGKAIDTNFSPAHHGTWERLSSGNWLWRLRIQSGDAFSLNLGFTQFQLPHDAKLYVRDPDVESVHGPYVKEDATRGQLWTPVVRGSEVVVELEIPSRDRSNLDLKITKVSHGFRSLEAAFTQKVRSKARACHIDVECPRADPWQDQVRSVGLYSYQRDGFSFICSGSLVNNTKKDGRPYFLTAEHCLQGSEDAAASMVFYWNYQNPTCRPPGSTESGTVTSDDREDQTSSGALLKMSYGNCENTSGGCDPSVIDGKPDIALVRVDDSIPAAYNLFLSGWDRTDFAPSNAVSVHHPQGHGKRITFEKDATSISGIRSSGDDHIKVDWAAGDGTTERGSSGGPLFSPSKKIIGVLSAGGSGCEITDWYGRVHEAWDGGGTAETRLRDWLDPTNSRATSIDGRNLANDANPPARARNFSVTNVTPDSVTLSWTAPGDDGLEGTASEYLLRYRRDAPINSKSDFEAAKQAKNVPKPKPAGAEQSTTIEVKQDTSYYFALVTLDSAGNASPLANIDRDVTPVPSLRVVTSPYPNPTRREVTLQFVVDKSQPVRAELYDALGRRLRVLYDEEPPSFQRRTISTSLEGLSSGIYFVRIRSNGVARTQKISVVR